MCDAVTGVGGIRRQPAKYVCQHRILQVHPRKMKALTASPKTDSFWFSSEPAQKTGCLLLGGLPIVLGCLPFKTNTNKTSLTKRGTPKWEGRGGRGARGGRGSCSASSAARALSWCCSSRAWTWRQAPFKPKAADEIRSFHLLQPGKTTYVQK